MGNEWEIEIWTNDQKLIDARPSADQYQGYAWVQMRRGDGTEELISALIDIKRLARPIRVIYRGFVDG